VAAEPKGEIRGIHADLANPYSRVDSVLGEKWIVGHRRNLATSNGTVEESCAACMELVGVWGNVDFLDGCQNPQQRDRSNVKGQGW